MAGITVAVMCMVGVGVVVAVMGTIPDDGPIGVVVDDAALVAVVVAVHLRSRR